MIGFLLMFKQSINEDDVNNAMNIGQNKKLTIRPEFEPNIFLVQVLEEGEGVLELENLQKSFIKWFK